MGDATVTDDRASGSGIVSEHGASTPSIWLLPMAMYANWWNAGMAVFAMPPINPHHAPCHDPHEQLIVPEAVGSESEQSLFA